MSQSQSQSNQQSRQPATRVLAAEFNAGTETFKEGDAERDPVFQLLPTGEAANRVFVVGTLTETEDISRRDSAGEYWRGRVVLPDGDPVFVYAGQYQPEPMSRLREFEVPAYVAVVGKPRTFENDDGDTYVNIQPETIQAVGGDTYDRYAIDAAAATLDRIEALTDEAAPYGDRSREAYDIEGEDLVDLQEAAINAIEMIGNEDSEVSEVDGDEDDEDGDASEDGDGNEDDEGESE